MSRLVLVLFALLFAVLAVSLFQLDNPVQTPEPPLADDPPVEKLDIQPRVLLRNI